MQCSHCGRHNEQDARFCVGCGVELLKAGSTKNPKACFNCGCQTMQDAKFCTSCGVELVWDRQHQPQRHRQTPSQPKKKGRRVDTRLRRHSAKVTLLILGGVLLFFSGLYWLEESRKPKDAEPFFETKSGDQTVEAKVKEITSKFICSCGTCGEQSLDICTCNTAIQERQFIRNALKSGQPLDRIFAAVNTTFGWMKPEFVVQYDSLARQPRASLRVKRGSANKIIGSSTNTE